MARIAMARRCDHPHVYEPVISRRRGRSTSEDRWPTNRRTDHAGRRLSVDHLLTDGHLSQIVAADPDLLGWDGRNDPQASPCHRLILTRPIRGTPTAPAIIRP